MKGKSGALAMEVEWQLRQQQHQEDSDELRQLQGQKRHSEGSSRQRVTHVQRKQNSKVVAKTAGTVHLGLRV